MSGRAVEQGSGAGLAALVATGSWRRWTLGYLLVQVPTTMGFVAFVLAGRHALGSAAWGVRLVATATILTGLGAPLTSRLLDRHGVGRGLRLTCLASAALLVALALATAWPGAAAGVLIVLAGAYGVASSAVVGGFRALLPSLVARGQVARASALEPVLTQVAFMVGPALAGVLAATMGVPGLLLVMAVCLTAAGVLAAARRAAGARAAPGPGPGARMPVSGRLWASPQVRMAYAITAGVAVAAGMTQAALAVWLEQARQRAELLGLLLAVQAVGACLASLVSGHRIVRVRAPSVHLVGLLCLAVACAATLGATTTLAVVLPAMTVLGVPLGLVYAADMMILQRAVTPQRQSEGFATLLAINILGVGVGQALSGWAPGAAAPAVFWAAAGVFAVTALLPYRAARAGVLAGPIWRERGT